MSNDLQEIYALNDLPENKRDKKRKDLIDKLSKQSEEIFDKRDMYVYLYSDTYILIVILYIL